MSGGNDRKRKHNKSYYVSKGAKRGKGSGWQTLAIGMKGFLLTCNFQEKNCVREAYNLLNQYADEMYGPEEGFLKDKAQGEGGSEEEEDLDAALKKEVQQMKDVKPKDRRFQVVDTGAKNCVFVRTTLDDPVSMVHKIMTDAETSGECKVRHIQRLLPISDTCKAFKDDINALMPKVLQPHLDTYPGGHPSFCVQFKVRNSNSIGRMDVYDIVGETMMNCVVDTNNPDIVVIVEVIKAVCCVSVVKDYFKFRKYNMHEIVQRTVDLPTKKTEKTVSVKGESEETVVVNSKVEDSIDSCETDMKVCENEDIAVTAANSAASEVRENEDIAVTAANSAASEVRENEDIAVTAANSAASEVRENKDKAVTAANDEKSGENKETEKDTDVEKSSEATSLPETN